VTDLTTFYLGLQLRSPLVASCSPITGEIDSLQRLEEAGIGAVVLPSLYEEEIVAAELELDRVLDTGAESYPEALTYFPDLQDYDVGPEGHLRLVEDAKAKLAVPVIASVNASSPGGWTGYARQLEDAGADAIELNIYRVAADPARSGAEVEQDYIDIVTEVRAALRVPLAVKIGPFFSSMAHMANRVVAAGADGLVLFNRFYQPDLNLETLMVEPRVELSDSRDLRLPLRWIAILHGQVRASIAATSGVHTAADVAKVLLVGADVAMMTAALLRNGPGHVAVLERELLAWMAEREYDSVAQLRGSASQRGAENPSAFERSQYIKALTTYAARH
jgi:dihydroorotate dehydrogenase (fumarate)